MDIEGWLNQIGNYKKQCHELCIYADTSDKELSLAAESLAKDAADEGVEGCSKEGMLAHLLGLRDFAIDE